MAGKFSRIRCLKYKNNTWLQYYGEFRIKEKIKMKIQTNFHWMTRIEFLENKNQEAVA